MNVENNFTDLLEEPIECQECFHGILINVDHMKVRLPNGGTSMREIVRHKGAVAVVPVDANGNVYMVRQHRIAVNRVLLEIPAGKLDYAEENPLDAAIRELEEETGLRAEKIEKMSQLITTPGFCTEIIGVFLATGLSQHEDHPDTDEFLQVEKYPLKEMIDEIMNGKITDAKTVAGLLMAWQRLRQC